MPFRSEAIFDQLETRRSDPRRMTADPRRHDHIKSRRSGGAHHRNEMRYEEPIRSNEIETLRASIKNTAGNQRRIAEDETLVRIKSPDRNYVKPIRTRIDDLSVS